MAARKLLTDVQVAEALGLNVNTLRKWRMFGNVGPRFLRIGKGSIRYDPTDLDRYLETRRDGGEASELDVPRRGTAGAVA